MTASAPDATHRLRFKAWLRSLERVSVVGPVAAGILRAGWRGLRLVLDPRARAVAVLSVTHARSLHQASDATTYDRFPELFERTRAHFADRTTPPRILSFGCSTGEEVFTLRRYFPESEIVGVDVNRRSLREARRRNTDPRIAIEPYSRRRMARLGTFDLILCLAVFQKTRLRRPEISDSSRDYPFARFDAELQTLDGALAPAGLLVIYLTNFHFADASVAAGYRPLPFELQGRLPKFGRDNRAQGRVVSEPVAFEKVGHWSP